MKALVESSERIELATEIATIEAMLLYLERELRDLGYELAARQCRMVSLGIAEQQFHDPMPTLRPSAQNRK